MYTYGRRIASWFELMSSIHGRDASDRAVLRKSILAAPDAIFRQPDRWIDPYLVEAARVRVRGNGWFLIRPLSDDLAHVLPSHNASLFRAINSLVSQGDVVVDAGANIGAISVYLAKVVGPEGRLLAIEMIPETADRLRQNLALNGIEHASVINAALSDNEGETVTAYLSNGFFGQASISRANVGLGREVRVRTTTLNAVLRDQQRISLLKMDLEGAEAAALRGALDCLERVEAVIFEVWNSEKSEAADILRDAGFMLYSVDVRNLLAVRDNERRKRALSARAVRPLTHVG